jgi:hypothetical protein
MALAQHLRNIDRLTEIQSLRQDSVHNDFVRDLHAMRDSFESERSELLEVHRERMADLNDIISVAEDQFAHEEIQATKEYVGTLQGAKERNTEVLIFFQFPPPILYWFF